MIGWHDGFAWGLMAGIVLVCIVAGMLRVWI
jgi:hypothetical protein